MVMMEGRTREEWKHVPVSREFTGVTREPAVPSTKMGALRGEYHCFSFQVLKPLYVRYMTLKRP